MIEIVSKKFNIKGGNGMIMIVKIVIIKIIRVKFLDCKKCLKIGKVFLKVNLECLFVII